MHSSTITFNCHNGILSHVTAFTSSRDPSPLFFFLFLMVMEVDLHTDDLLPFQSLNRNPPISEPFYAFVEYKHCQQQYQLIRSVSAPRGGPYESGHSNSMYWLVWQHVFIAATSSVPYLHNYSELTACPVHTVTWSPTHNTGHSSPVTWSFYCIPGVKFE